MGDKAKDYGRGRVYLRGRTYWIDYSFQGTRYQESSHSDKVADANKLLKKRQAEMQDGHVSGAAGERLTIPQLCDSLITALETAGAKSIDSYKVHLKPIREAFRLVRAVALTTRQVRDYIEKRQKDGMANATINRETASLRQALNLSRKDGVLRHVPHVPMLTEDNARQGFFERADFEAVAAKLPEPVNDIARYGYLTGWRKGEILPMGWSQVDRSARTILLPDSKNGEARTLGYEEGSELHALIERRWTAREYETENGTALSEFVFHSDGRKVVDFGKRWHKACEDAKVPGRIFHDLRRTAIRDMVRAGVGEDVAMSISGHKTASVFRRYNITSEDDRRDALKRVQAYRSTLPATRDNVIPMAGK